MSHRGRQVDVANDDISLDRLPRRECDTDLKAPIQKMSKKTPRCQRPLLLQRPPEKNKKRVRGALMIINGKPGGKMIPILLNYLHASSARPPGCATPPAPIMHHQ